MLLTTPLIDAASRRWPGAKIHVLGSSGTLGPLRGNQQVDELIEVEPGTGWLQSWSLIKRLWRRYDLGLIADYSDRAHLYGAVSSRHRSGMVLNQGSSSWWKRLLLDHVAVVDENQKHAVLEKLRVIAPWAEPPPQVHVQPPPGRELPSNVARQLRPRYVVVQVPARMRFRQWPLANQAGLVRGLLVDGLQVVLTGGPSEGDRTMTAEVASAVEAKGDGRLLDLGGSLDLNQMVTLLNAAALYVGPDTSITHLAAACGTKLIALYGPMNPQLWGPWPQNNAPLTPYKRSGFRQSHGLITLLQGDQPCVPCVQAGCDRHNESGSECLESMHAQRVLDEARIALRSTTESASQLKFRSPEPPTEAVRRAFSAPASIKNLGRSGKRG